MTQTKKQRTQETLIIGHHLKGHHFFGKKDYVWRIRHHKTAGKKFLKIGQLAWVNITDQKRPAPVIITNIKTLTGPTDCQQARWHQTVKKISLHSVEDLSSGIVAKYKQFMANQTVGK